MFCMGIKIACETLGFIVMTLHRLKKNGKQTNNKQILVSDL